jgi:hypothetical protein
VVGLLVGAAVLGLMSIWLVGQMRPASVAPRMSDGSGVDAISVRADAASLDLSDLVRLRHTEGNGIEVSTAPGPDGIVLRVGVRAREAGKNWAVFALANTGDASLDRLIVAPHYRMSGSGLVWPDLGRSRIAYITPSSGDLPKRRDSANADIFHIRLEPRSVVTFVAELRTNDLPQLFLWQPDAYKDKINSLTLYQGTVIGLLGLLASLLTALCVTTRTMMFSASAALAWASLVYIGADSGFWNMVLDMSAANDRIGRLLGEGLLSATLMMFLFAYFKLSRWGADSKYVMILSWIAFIGAAIVFAFFAPAVSAGIARISLLLVVVLGIGLIAYLSIQGCHRAVTLVTAWMLLVAWSLGAALTMLGFVTSDMAEPVLHGGLMLVVMLIGFSVIRSLWR